jgi:hypothetical protein
MSSKLNLALAFLLVALLEVGCAATGKPYEPVTLSATDANKAVVYVYRSPAFVGSAVSYTVNASTKPLVKLVNGGYYPYVTNPGEVEIWAETEAKSSVTVDLKPGDRKYVKGTVGVGFLVGRPSLTLVDPATAQAEIKECKLIAEEVK